MRGARLSAFNSLEIRQRHKTATLFWRRRYRKLGLCDNLIRFILHRVSVWIYFRHAETGRCLFSSTGSVCSLQPENVWAGDNWKSVSVASLSWSVCNSKSASRKNGTNWFDCLQPQCLGTLKRKKALIFPLTSKTKLWVLSHFSPSSASIKPPKNIHK